MVLALSVLSVARGKDTVAVLSRAPFISGIKAGSFQIQLFG